ncbi:MAG: hypothetical protein ACPL7E_05950, partial [bacterium]
MERGNTCRSLIPTSSGWQRDTTPDASVLLLPLLNLHPLQEEDFSSLVSRIENALWVKTRVGGMSRYRGD